MRYLSALTLILFNLIPLYLGIHFNWNISSFFIIYWLENGITNTFFILKQQLTTKHQTQTVNSLSSPPWPIRLIFNPSGFFAAFFIAQGFILLFIHLHLNLPFSPKDILLGTLPLLVSHTISFITYFLINQNCENIPPGYYSDLTNLVKRTFALQVAIISIVFVSIIIKDLGSPFLWLTLIVTIKTSLDLYLHLQEHKTPKKFDNVSS